MDWRAVYEEAKAISPLQGTRSFKLLTKSRSPFKASREALTPSKSPLKSCSKPQPTKSKSPWVSKKDK
jgi:hypothetical protein